MKSPFIPCLIMLLIAGCTDTRLKKEIEDSLANPGTARASDFMLALYGWPSTVNPQVLSIDVSTTPESGPDGGSGIADIAVKCGISGCASRIGFVYSKQYMGRHGIGGGNELVLTNIQRLDPVNADISDPHDSRETRLGSVVTGNLSVKSHTLPDGSYAEYYSVNLDAQYPLARFVLDRISGSDPHGYVYQNGYLKGTIVSSPQGIQPAAYDNVIPLVKGKAVIMITAGKEKSSFRLRIHEPDDSVRSILKLPAEYRKKL